MCSSSAKAFLSSQYAWCSTNSESESSTRIQNGSTLLRTLSCGCSNGTYVWEGGMYAAACDGNSGAQLSLMIAMPYRHSAV